jgi:hypothetical protein
MKELLDSKASSTASSLPDPVNSGSSKTISNFSPCELGLSQRLPSLSLLTCTIARMTPPPRAASDPPTDPPRDQPTSQPFGESTPFYLSQDEAMCIINDLLTPSLSVHATCDAG